MGRSKGPETGEKMDAFPDHFRAKREHLDMFQGLLPESHGQNLALTVLYVPESGLDCLICAEFARQWH